jgi:hypothetical protein
LSFERLWVGLPEVPEARPQRCAHRSYLADPRVGRRIPVRGSVKIALLDRGAVEGAFGADMDYAQLVKLYGPSSELAKSRYSPIECISALASPSSFGKFVIL